MWKIDETCEWDFNGSATFSCWVPIRIWMHRVPKRVWLGQILRLPSAVFRGSFCRCRRPKDDSNNTDPGWRWLLGSEEMWAAWCRNPLGCWRPSAINLRNVWGWWKAIYGALGSGSLWGLPHYVGNLQGIYFYIYVLLGLLKQIPPPKKAGDSVKFTVLAGQIFRSYQVLSDLAVSSCISPQRCSGSSHLKPHSTLLIYQAERQLVPTCSNRFQRSGFRISQKIACIPGWGSTLLTFDVKSQRKGWSKSLKSSIVISRMYMNVWYLQSHRSIYSISTSLNHPFCWRKGDLLTTSSSFDARLTSCDVRKGLRGCAPRDQCGGPTLLCLDLDMVGPWSNLFFFWGGCIWDDNLKVIWMVHHSISIDGTPVRLNT